MNSESAVDPSAPRRKNEDASGPAQAGDSGGAFGPLRYDDRERGGEAEGEALSDLNDSKSGGPPCIDRDAAARRGDVAVRRGELAILKGAAASVIYEMAVRCFLEMGRPAVLVDGGCQADPYEVAAIAKRLGRGMAGGGTGNGGMAEAGSGSGATTGKATRQRRVDEDEVLRNIHVARAFTAHQFEALIVSRLPPMLERIRPAFVGVMSIDVLFFDEELDVYEARIMQVRCVRTLRRLVRDHNLLAAATESGSGRRGGMRWW